MPKTLPVTSALKSFFLLLLFLSNGVIHGQSLTPYVVDNSGTDYTLIKAVGLPSGKSAVIYRDNSYNYKCSIVSSTGTVTGTFDFTSKMSLQNTPNRIEVNALGTSSGNIFITYTSFTSDGPPNSINAKYLVLDQTGAVVYSGNVNSSNLGTTLNRYIQMDQLSNGNVVMVWLQSDNQTGGYRIFQPNGTPVTSDASFAGPATGSIFNCLNLFDDNRVGANPNGGFLITFYYYTGHLQGILFDNNGVVQQVGGSNTFTIDPTTAGSYYNFSVLGLSNGNYMVAWSENSSGGNKGYYKIISSSGSDVKAKTPFPGNLQTDVGNDAWVEAAANNTSSSPGFVIADYSWQDYYDYSNPYAKAVCYNFDLSGNYLSTQDASPYYIADYYPALSVYSGNPSGVGVAYVNYNSYTPFSDGSGYTVSGENISGSLVSSTASLSNNATLSNLTVSSGTLSPVFASGTISYAASVSNATSTITVTPTVAESHATVTVNTTPVASGSASGSIPLAVGANTITVKVTAQDGVTTKTYTLTITRAAAPNITSSGSFSGLNTTYGNPSGTSTINVSGTNLTSGITATVSPSSVFELSSDGTSFTSSVSIGSSGTVSGTVYVRLKASAPAGTYTGTVSLSSADFTGPTVTMPSSTVNKASLTITADDKNRTYGQANPALTASYSGFVNGDAATSLSTQPTLTATATTSSPVGSFTITASGAAASNYTISYQAGNLAVTPAALTITANSVSKTYGQTLTGGTGSTAFTQSGLVNGETIGGVTITYGTGAAASDAVGTYTGQVTASAATGGTFNAANYTITYGKGYIVVNAAPATITFAAIPNQSYGNADFDPGATSTNTVTPVTYTSSNPLVATIVSNKIHIVGAGTTTISALQAADANHSAATNQQQSLTVDPKALTVTLNSTPAISKIYNGTNGATLASGNYTLNGVVGTDVVTVSGMASYDDAGVGTGKTVTVNNFTLAGAQKNNYIVSTSSATSTGVISARPVTVSADAKTKVYGQSDPALTYQIISGSLVSSDAFTGSLTRDAGEGAASYAIRQGTLALSNNYALTYTGANLAINKASLTITADDKSKTYGNANPVLTVSFSGFISGDNASSLTTAPTITTTATTTSGVGTYTIGVSGAVSSNYTISYGNGTLTITPATPVITFNALPAKTYGDADFDGGATTDNIETPIEYTSSNLSVATIVGGKIHVVGAGTTIITTSQPADANHYAATDQLQTLTISPAAITVTADVKSKVYGQSDPALTYQITSGALVGTDGFSGSLTRDAGENVGSYGIRQGTLVLSSNYTLTYNSASLTINKAAITVTAGTKTKIYGQSDPALTYQITTGGLVGADTFTGSLIRDAGESSGTYGINQGTLSAGNNYSITYVGANLTIAPAAITITADAQNKVYGQGDPALTYQITSGALVGADSFTGALSRDAGENVGSYGINQGTLALNSNYSLTYNSASLTIGQAALTITADNKIKVYGTANPPLTVSYSGFVNGDNASSLTTAPTLVTSAVSTSPVGHYTITASGAADPNYTISYVAGNLSVGPATLTITADDKTKVYGQNNPGLTVSYNGFVNGDDESKLTAPAVATTIATATSLTGSYDITVSGAASLNYTIVYSNGTLTITPAVLTVTADDKTKVYGMVNPALTLHYSGFVNNDDISSISIRPSAATNASATSDVGSYTIAPSGGVSDKYNFVYVNGNLTITPKTLLVNAQAQTKTYGDADPALTYDTNGLVGSDALRGNLVRVAGNDAGSYTILQGSLSAGNNYVVAYQGADLTITPKPVAVAVDAQTKTYGQADPAFTYSVSPALVGGDAFSGTLSRAPGEDAGTYAIHQGSLNNPNYAISFTGNVLTIGKAAQQITWVQSLSMGCDGVSRSTLTATASSGLPVSYSSADAGIAVINGNEVVMTGAGTVILTASQPGNQNYQPAPAVTNTLTDKLPSSMVVKRWEDVLVFDNSSNQYTEWQWYKNGAAISGANGQYYTESGKLNGSYYAMAKTKAGATQQTCPVRITPGSTIIPIAIFPNPVAPGGTVLVKTDYSSTELQGATIVVSNMLGVVVQTVQTVTPQTNVTMPVAQGIYVIRLRLVNGVTASVNALVKGQE